RKAGGKDWTEEIVLELSEAVRQGADGIHHDLLRLSRPWGLALDRITAPVLLWHGEADTLMPLAPVRAFAALIPGCEAHFVPEAGPLLLMSPEVAPQILSRLLSAGS